MSKMRAKRKFLIGVIGKSFSAFNSPLSTHFLSESTLPHNLKNQR